jgi:TetR/AcrR family transcriptional repressor of mexJK operon
MTVVNVDREETGSATSVEEEPRTPKQTCILEAATTVFLREGFERASVDVIAAEADVSKRTIYNHFTDKRGLFLAVIHHKLHPADLATALDPANLKSAVSIRVDLTALGNRMVDEELSEDVASLRRVLIADINRFPELKAACKQMFPWDAVHLLAGRLSELFPDQLTVDLAETALTQFLSMIGAQAQARSAFWAVPVPDEVRDRFINDAVDLIVRAYRLED